MMRTQAHSRWHGSATGCSVGTCACLAVSAAWAAGPTGVKLDGTLGGSVATLAGPAYNITQSLGKLAGGNLFFSFQYFNIATGQTAQFSTTSPGIGNVISRVTGGYASSIDGTISLQAASGAPNFFFINPNGVTFTSDAKVNVPAAFYVTTANYLKFSDGNFYADASKTSTLSTAAPEAFGFLGSTRAPVVVTGATLSAGNSGDGEFQLVAGDVGIEGTGAPAGIANGSGNVRVIATGAQATEVPLTGPFASNDGSVALLYGGLLETAGGPASAAGGIYVSAGTLLVNGDLGLARTGILSIGGGNGGGPITLDVAGEAALADGANIISYPAYAGAGASVTLNAGSLAVQGSSPNWVTGIQTSTDMAANAGAVVLNVAGATAIVDGGKIASQTSASGNAGAVLLKTGSLSIDGESSGLPTGFFNTAQLGSSGNAGPVSVTVSGAASIANAGNIATTTYTSGNAGDVSFAAASLSIDGESATALTGILSSSIATPTTIPTGNSGRVSVTTTGATSLSSGGQILSTTIGPGSSGNIDIAAGSLSIDRGTSSVFTGISSSALTSVSRNSGEVSITTTGATTLSDGGQILAASASSGNGGDVNITAGSLCIDGASSSTFTGISSSALTSTSGNSGQVSISTSGATTLSSGGAILTASESTGSGGAVTVSAASLTIDGGTYSGITGIVSSATSKTSGNSGPVSVVTTGATRISNGGMIESNTFALGNGGNVAVRAASLDIDGGPSARITGLSSSAAIGSGGDAGQISVVTTGATTLASGGQIASTTSASGKAGDVTLTAAAVSIDSGTSATVDTAILTSASAGSSGDAGQVSVKAGSLSVDGGASTAITGISSRADQGSRGNAGEVSVSTTGATTLVSGGEILSTTRAVGKAGHVTLTADSLSIDGGTSTILTGISTSAAAGSGSAGEVSVSTTGATTLSDGGEILSATYTTGHAGDVTLSAGSVSLEGATSSRFKTTVSSDAQYGSSGNAGDVTLSAGSLTINGGASSTLTAISSSADAGASGNAGQVFVTTSGATTLSSGAQIISTTSGVGKAGDVTLKAGSLSIDAGTASNFATGIASDALPASSGPAGQVSVTTTGGTTLFDGGEIESTTSGAGKGGDVTLVAGYLSIDGGSNLGLTGISTSALSGSSGTAGQVAITTTGGTNILSGGEIQSVTFAAGNAGNVTLNAASLSIDAGTYTAYNTGIASSADRGSSGNAGEVSITTSGATTVSGGGEIQSETFALGNAGNVKLKAGSLTIDASHSISKFATGITTQADSGSKGLAGTVAIDVSGAAQLLNGGQIISTARSGTSGQPGTVAISAGTLVLGTNAQISIENDASIANPALIKPTQIDIQAGTIQMNGGLINAMSNGNINASSINVSFGQLLSMDPSAISTSSQQGNGGAISISGHGPLWIEDSNITTSVRGQTNGNGGDISINVPYILLSTGAIQANTLAPQASGGDVTIDAQALIPSYNSYVLGGNSLTFDPTTAGLNVVQAAAPDGVSGTLSVTVPTLDLGNSLVGLIGAPAKPTPLGRSLCTYRQGSSLSMTGRGGLPGSARDPLWVDADEAADDALAPATAGGQPAGRLGTLAVFACR